MQLTIEILDEKRDGRLDETAFFIAKIFLLGKPFPIIRTFNTFKELSQTLETIGFSSISKVELLWRNCQEGEKFS